MRAPEICPVFIAAFIALAPSISNAQGWPDEPGIYPNRDYVNQNFAEHIDPFNGNLQLHYVDGFVPGNGGFDLKIQRSYNAQDPGTSYSPFGGGWQIHFGQMQHNTPSCTNSNMVMEAPDGSRHRLMRSNGVAGTQSGVDFITMTFWKEIGRAHV